MLALVDEAVRSTASLIDRLAPLCAERSDDATKVLHELKGLSRTIGAQELGALSEQAEGFASAGRWDDLSESLEGLQRAQTRFAGAAEALGDDIAGSE